MVVPSVTITVSSDGSFFGIKIANRTHVLERRLKRHRSLFDSNATLQRTVLRQMRQKQEEQNLTVRIAEDVSPEPGRDALEQLRAVFGKILNVAVVGEDPLAVLEWMTVQHGELTVGGAPHVRQHGFGGNDAAHAMEQGIVECRCRAPGDVRGAVDVKRHAPTVAVVVALGAERIVGVHQRTVDLALNHAAKPK